MRNVKFAKIAMTILYPRTHPSPLLCDGDEVVQMHIVSNNDFIHLNYNILSLH